MFVHTMNLSAVISRPQRIVVGTKTVGFEITNYVLNVTYDGAVQLTAQLPLRDQHKIRIDEGTITVRQKHQATNLRAVVDVPREVPIARMR